jgi:hypothetical protein
MIDTLAMVLKIKKNPVIIGLDADTKDLSKNYTLRVKKGLRTEKKYLFGLLKKEIDNTDIV